MAEDIDALVRDLLTISTDAEGAETWALTEEGARLGRMLAMGGDDAEVVLDALLLAAEAQKDPLDPETEGVDGGAGGGR